MSGKLIATTYCPNCGYIVEITQDIKNGEYVPFGKCESCKQLVLEVYDGVIAIDADKLYTGGTCA